MYEEQDSKILWILGDDEFNPTITDLISIDIDGDELDDIITDHHIFFGNTLQNQTEMQISNADIIFDDTNYPPKTAKNAGDIDGDGLDDVFVFGSDPSSGVKGYLFLATSLSNGTFLVQDADFHFTDHNQNDIFELNMTSLGDIDDDGLGDIMIAVPSAPGFVTPVGELYYYTGRVYVFLGSQLVTNNNLSLDEAQYTLVGYDHTYIGAQMTTLDAGVLINAGGSMYSWVNNTDCTGTNWIRYDDLLSLSPGIHHIKNVSTLMTYEAEIGYCFISNVSGVDFNGDGTITPLFQDGYYTSDEHLGRFVNGGIRLSTNNGISHVFEGEAVSGRGDFDGDGKGDIWMSNRNTESNDGKGYLFLSSSSWSETEVLYSEADMRWSDNSNYRFGGRVFFAGDLNDDNCDELGIVRKEKTTGVFDLGIIYGCPE